MRTLSARDRRALLLGAAVAAGLLGYARLARPALAALRGERLALGDSLALLARERALVAAAPRLPRAVHAARAALDSTAALLFAGDSVRATAELSAFVSDVARATGMRLTSVEGRTPERVGPLTRVQVELRGEGSWRQTLHFLESLEGARQLVDVNAVRVERGTVSTGAGPAGGPLVALTVLATGFSRENDP